MYKKKEEKNLKSNNTKIQKGNALGIRFPNPKAENNSRQMSMLLQSVFQSRKQCWNDLCLSNKHVCEFYFAWFYF